MVNMVDAAIDEAIEGSGWYNEFCYIIGYLHEKYNIISNKNFY
jgi:hypothetical protein